ncbi:DUF3311 domain-containing protein [Streptomyces sp. NPDC005322]|uniref:DUF3311 domain-containing protein n=1 Tax=Streptomyces sp. NPDC005322 TaxID=3157032 RepID=UPI0033AEFCD8
MFRNRKSLWWLLGTPLAYLGVLPLANRVHPTLLGIPFLALWLVIATFLTPLFVWLAARRDPVWQAARNPGERDHGAGDHGARDHGAGDHGARDHGEGEVR